MATTVFANAVVNHPVNQARTVFRTSGGTVYALYQDATNNIRCAKLSGTFSEQDATGVTTGRVFNADIDSSDVIHVFKYDTNDNVSYVSFDTATDSWGTPEDLGYTEEAGYEGLIVSVACDANDVPHAIFCARTAGAGGNKNSVMYTNRIGGTWGSPRLIEGGTNNNEVYPHALSFDNSGFPVITYSSVDNNDVRVVTMDATNGLTANLTDTQLQAVTIYADPDFGGARSGGILFDGSTRYISYCPDHGTDTTEAILYEGATKRFETNTPDRAAHQICLLPNGDLLFVYHSSGDIFYDVWDAVAHSFDGETNLTNDGGLTPTFLSVTRESTAGGLVDVTWYDSTDTDLVYEEITISVAVTGTHTGTITAATGTGEGSITVAQRLTPDADDSIGSWSDQAGGTTSIYLTIDEVPGANDADYIRSEQGPTSSIYRARLSDPSGGTPDTDQPITVFYRARASSASGTSSLIARLKEGTTTRATWTESNVSDSWTNFSHDLSVGEKAAITDWTNLFLEFEATVT